MQCEIANYTSLLLYIFWHGSLSMILLYITRTDCLLLKTRMKSKKTRLKGQIQERIRGRGTQVDVLSGTFKLCKLIFEPYHLQLAPALLIDYALFFFISLQVNFFTNHLNTWNFTVVPQHVAHAQTNSIELTCEDHEKTGFDSVVETSHMKDIKRNQKEWINLQVFFITCRNCRGLNEKYARKNELSYNLHETHTKTMIW